MPDQNKLEGILLQRPTAVANPTQLPEGDPNDASAQVMRALDAFFNGPFAKRTEGVNSRIPEFVGGAAGILPIGGLLGKIRGMLPKARVAEQAPEMLSGVKNALSATDEFKAGPTLPHEFQLPPQRTPVPYSELLKQDELTKLPTPSRNRGSVDMPHDGGLPKHKELIPQYRSKSGMALDVLDEMKNTKPLPYPTAQTHLQQLGELSEVRGKTPTVWNDNGYEGPIGFDNPAASAAIKNEARFDPDEVYMDSNPEKMIARFKGLDDQAGFKSSRHKLAEEELFGKQLPHPMLIDNLIQDLSNYFSGPRFDPFHPENPANIPAAADDYFGSILKRKK